MEEYQGKARLVVKMYPYRYRDFAHISAEAALAARDQGRFCEMHRLLLEKSPDLDRDSLLEYARQVGLDMEKFRRDLDGMRHKELIEQDKDLAKSMDIYNTPTFFVNGRKIIGNIPYAYFKKVMQEELDALGN